jgi:hypothetical protein
MRDVPPGLYMLPVPSPTISNDPPPMTGGFTTCTAETIHAFVENADQVVTTVKLNVCLAKNPRPPYTSSGNGSKEERQKWTEKERVRLRNPCNYVKATPDDAQ